MLGTNNNRQSAVQYCFRYYQVNFKVSKRTWLPQWLPAFSARNRI